MSYITDQEENNTRLAEIDKGKSTDLFESIRKFLDSDCEVLKRGEKMDGKCLDFFQQQIRNADDILNSSSSTEDQKAHARSSIIYARKQIRDIHNHPEKTQLIKWGMIVGSVTISVIAISISRTKTQINN